ncbi:uncharacterized protein [Spinacia oleracea]|uniref:Uncharacterized protein isoform X2 n=1 Tax=Spinacia oleracea TaxID=3562 RepID=A0A9R0IMB1_SPIOL|nr:uncharacterized protein LOC110791232 isoform X2 [Spinacia oleracea]
MGTILPSNTWSVTNIWIYIRTHQAIHNCKKSLRLLHHLRPWLLQNHPYLNLLPYLQSPNFKHHFSLSQPSSKPLQHSISSTLTGAPQAQRKTDESRWSCGPLFPNLIQIAAEKEAEKEAHHAKPHNATQQPHKATHQPQKVSPNSVKATRLPHKAVQQPIVSSFTGAQPYSEKKSFVPPTGLKKHVLSRPPPTPSPSDSMIRNKNGYGDWVSVQRPPTYMVVSANTSPMERSTPSFHVERSTPSIQVETEIMPNNSSDEPDESVSESEEELNEGDGGETSVKASKPRRRIIVANWPKRVKFDEKEEVLVIDANGKCHLVKGSVQPRDFWTDEKGFRYYVKLNEFCQPLQKGGSILVTFLGDIAKKDSLCLVGIKTWRAVNKKLKSNIVTMVREHFVIPDGLVVDKAVVRRTGKSWKNNRYILKKRYFDPVNKTLDQNYDSIPDGISSSSWNDLVDYWFSLKGTKEKKGEYSELTFYKSVYAKEDGSFKEGTISRQFMEDANNKV